MRRRERDSRDTDLLKFNSHIDRFLHPVIRQVFDISRNMYAWLKRHRYNREVIKDRFAASFWKGLVRIFRFLRAGTNREIVNTRWWFTKVNRENSPWQWTTYSPPPPPPPNIPEISFQAAARTPWKLDSDDCRRFVKCESVLRRLETHRGPWVCVGHGDASRVSSSIQNRWNESRFTYEHVQAFVALEVLGESMI